MRDKLPQRTFRDRPQNVFRITTGERELAKIGNAELNLGRQFDRHFLTGHSECFVGVVLLTVRAGPLDGNCGEAALRQSGHFCPSRTLRSEADFNRADFVDTLAAHSLKRSRPAPMYARVERCHVPAKPSDDGLFVRADQHGI